MRETRETRIAPVVVLVTIFMLVCALWLAASAAPAAGSPSPSPSPSPQVQSIEFEYVAWNGTVQPATLLLPLGYSPGEASALPCILHLHGRGAQPAYASTAWGDLPTRYGFAVICPSSVARDGTGNSWAAPGQIDDVLRMPDVVEAEFPGLKLDRDRLYLAGSSMGGQESLVTLARAPDQFAAVAAYDGAADLAARYWEMGTTGSLLDQAKLRRELQGTPRRQPFSYAQRSPLSYAQALASCRVPILVTWSTADEMVVNGGKTQFGRLCRRLRALDPQVPLTEVVTALPHGQALRADPEAVVRFFAPDGIWRTRSPAAPSAWSYAGWQTKVRVWGHTVEVPGMPGARWWRLTVGADSLSVSAPAYVRLRLPWTTDDDRPVALKVDGLTRRVRPRDGALVIGLLSGSHVVAIPR